MPDCEMTAFLEGVIGAVLAYSYEHHMLWVENQKAEKPLTWEDVNPGLLEVAGYCHDTSGKSFPTCISLFKARVGGHLLLFWHPTSQIVDFRLIEEWMKTNLPETAFVEYNGVRCVNQTDAMNFHNIFPR